MEAICVHEIQLAIARRCGNGLERKTIIPSYSVHHYALQGTLVLGQPWC